MEMSNNQNFVSSKYGKRDIHWIRGALQSAVAIEHATMPLYSAAMYSLEVQNYPAYNTLRSVLMEEMLHMAAAANALAAIGGAPRIRQLNPSKVLDGLPAPISTGLSFRFAQLSRKQLDMFMRIEAPEQLLPLAERQARYPTIGSFYASISEAVEANADVVSAAVRGRKVANQVGGNLGYAVIDDISENPVDQILESLQLIADQGEGAAKSTLSSGPQSEEELSHYARFAELRFGRRYSGPAHTNPAEFETEGQRRYFQGEHIEWPVVINSLATPSDGYAAILRLDPDRDEVLNELRAFDESYSRMLIALDDAWNGPIDASWPSLGRAVFEMNELRVLSCFSILRRQIPSEAVDRIDTLYPVEATELRALSDFSKPLFYGPRFLNTAVNRR